MSNDISSSAPVTDKDWEDFWNSPVSTDLTPNLVAEKPKIITMKHTCLGNRYCTTCGTKLPDPYCTSCKAAVYLDWIYCGDCGNKLK